MERAGLRVVAGGAAAGRRRVEHGRRPHRGGEAGLGAAARRAAEERAGPGRLRRRDARVPDLADRPSRRLQYSVGMVITAPVEDAIGKIPAKGWTPAYDAEGIERPGAWVAELTGVLDLAGWPRGMRVIARKERPHPGAQLRITDIDGHRVTCFATSTKGGQLVHGPNRKTATEPTPQATKPASRKIEARVPLPRATSTTGAAWVLAVVVASSGIFGRRPSDAAASETSAGSDRRRGVAWRGVARRGSVAWASNRRISPTIRLIRVL